MKQNVATVKDKSRKTSKNLLTSVENYAKAKSGRKQNIVIVQGQIQSPDPKKKRQTSKNLPSSVENYAKSTSRRKQNVVIV